MATLEKIRSKAGVLVSAIIGLSLLAFILTDFFSAKKSMFSRTDNVIGIFNGKKVEVQQYEQKVNELTEVYKIKSGSSSIDEKALDGLRDEAWQEIVSENVFEVEYTKLGLVISPDELIEYLTGSKIHPIVKQVFTDPQTGEFNKNFVIQFLKKTNEPTDQQRPFRIYLEYVITNDLIKNKYYNLIKKGLGLPSFAAKAAYKDINYNIDFDFIEKKYSDVPDKEISVTDADLKKYYKTHGYKYNQTASRDLEYVTFDIQPSKADTADAREWINKIKPDFESTADVEQFVNENSDMPYVNKSYKQTEIPDSLGNFYNAPVGEVYGPYYNGSSFKLARMYKKISMPDSIKVRHILIAPNGKTEEDLSRAKSLADSLMKVILKDSKVDFGELAKRYSDDKGSAVKGGDLGWIKEGLTVKPFNDSAFSAKTGDTKLVETDFGFHILQVTEKSKEEKKVRIAFLERKLNYSQQTFNQIYAKVMKFANENQTYPKFIQAIEKQKLVKKLASNLVEGERAIPGLDSPKPILRWAFEAKKGEISEPKQIQNQFVIAALSEIRLKGTAPFEIVRNDVEAQVRKEKKIDKLSALINKEKSHVSSIQDLGLKLEAGVQTASHISFNSYNLQNSGIEPDVIGFASGYPKNQISSPIGGNNGVYVIYITDVQYTPGKDFSDEKLKYYYTLSQRAVYEGQNSLVKLADITDKRIKFY